MSTWLANMPHAISANKGSRKMIIGEPLFSQDKLRGWGIRCGAAHLPNLTLTDVRDELARLSAKFPKGEFTPVVVIETPSGLRPTLPIGDYSLMEILLLDSVIA
jgi:hypothetical protein